MAPGHHESKQSPHRASVGVSTARTLTHLNTIEIQMTVPIYSCGAVGSALPWHGRGREFESHQVHQNVSYTYRFPARQDVATGVQLESKTSFQHGQPWASCGFRCLPTAKPTDSMRWRVWAPWAPFFARVVFLSVSAGIKHPQFCRLCRFAPPSAWVGTR